ncbi:hypothetical protein, partial [Bauldia litoralis]|uniref:hypothetical protein n=1 Tax=Bauldia litoralis TaxID=665467 RepID=UPI0032969E17
MAPRRFQPISSICLPPLNTHSTFAILRCFAKRSLEGRTIAFNLAPSGTHRPSTDPRQLLAAQHVEDAIDT